MDEEDKRHEVSAIARVPRLYMTDWVGAASVNESNILEITHILSVMTAGELEQYGPDESPGVELRHLDIADEPAAAMLQHLDKQYVWIDDVLTNFRASDGRQGAIIVHCQQGISRSAAVIVAYLMKKFDMDFDEAMKELKNSRSIVNMNPGFQDQLRKHWRVPTGRTTPDRQPRRDTVSSLKTPIKELHGPWDIIDWREDPEAHWR